MTTFRTLASGSGGNAALLDSHGTRLLIDLGISCRRLVQALSALGLKPEDLDALLVTHEHRDHICGLATYIKKYRTPIFCTPGTLRQLSCRLAGVECLLRPAPMGASVPIGSTSVTPLPTSHDCAESCAFRVDTPDGVVGYLTDTGTIPEETGRRLLGADLLVLESNHDEDMLRCGPYPYQLKARILGAQGHLSNVSAARYAAASALAGTRTIVLAHLSQENNTPQLALAAMRAALEAAGSTARLDTAPRDTMSQRYQLEAAPCSM